MSSKSSILCIPCTHIFNDCIGANGSDTLETNTLNNPPGLSGTASISSPISCFNACDGELTFQVDNILIVQLYNKIIINFRSRTSKSAI